jgi:mannose-1-phosphate guanylyltransferase
MVRKRAWAVILAGGNGTRLQPLTRLLCEDNRPKQYCALLGGETLLAQTRARVAQAIAPERTLFAVVRAHECFYEDQLADVKPSRMIVQPANKGTTPAIVYSLVKLLSLDEHAIVCFFPADHYYAEDQLFVRAVDRAVQLASENSGSVILLGATPRSPETAYGYIEPGARLKGTPGWSAFWVNRFWEKPSLNDAWGLLERGCLWNTFVMIGGVTAFLRILELGAPTVLSALTPVEYLYRSGLDTTWATDAYSLMEPSDFSEAVLSQRADALAVLELGDVEWSDLGEPDRAMAAMARMNGAKNGRRDWASAQALSQAGPMPVTEMPNLRANPEEVKCTSSTIRKERPND